MIKEKELKQSIYDSKDIMYRLALSILENEADAEDVLQDVFVKCWDQKNNIHITSDIRGYLIQSTRNRCLDMIKKHNRKYEQAGIDETVKSEAFNPTELWDQLEWIDRFLRQLPEINRTVFHLREVEGLPFKEISSVTNTNVPNIRTILSRTKKHLRKQFEILSLLENRVNVIKTEIK